MAGRRNSSPAARATALVIALTCGVATAAPPRAVAGVEQCIVRHIEQSPAGYQNRCSEPVTLHFRDMHQPYSVTVPAGATRNPNPMGTPYFVCPASVSGQSVGFDWQTRTCQVRK